MRFHPAETKHRTKLTDLVKRRYYQVKGCKVTFTIMDLSEVLYAPTTTT